MKAPVENGCDDCSTLSLLAGLKIDMVLCLNTGGVVKHLTHFYTLESRSLLTNTTHKQPYYNISNPSMLTATKSSLAMFKMIVSTI